MNILDDLNLIKKIDQDSGYKSLELLPDQIRQVVKDSIVLKIPKEYSKIDNIVVAGMGGSNLGARLIQSVFKDELKKPLTILASYEVPAFVNEKTLFILSSYSGTTEEVLSVYPEAQKRKAKILAITSKSGKGLEKLMLKNNIPGYIFEPEFNPANSPRLAVGYSVFGLAVLLAKAGLLKLETQKIESLINKMELWDRALRPEVKSRINLAKQIAVKIKGKIPVMVGAEFLEGNVFILRNQFCETAKNFANYLILPDLNHFAMEGLGMPVTNQNNLIFIFFDSDLFSSQIKKRMQLTKAVVKKNGIKIIEHTLRGQTKLEQAMELLQFGSYVTYYLAMLNEKNPLPNPWVDWFKENLK